MTTPYPSLCATRRAWTPGEYPTRRFTAVNGAGSTRLYGSRAFDATLQLEYVLSDADLAALLECYNNARGTFDGLTLPPETFVGLSVDVQAEIPDYLTWRWADTPQIDSVAPGRSRVRVNLVGTLDD